MALTLPPPSRAFLDELRERARRLGWTFDYVEIRQFVLALHIEAGVELSDADLEPYPDES